MKNNLTFVFKYTYLCCMKAHKLIFENFSRLSVRGQECDSCAFIPQNPKFEVTLSGVASFFSHILFTHPQQGWLITSSQKQKRIPKESELCVYPKIPALIYPHQQEALVMWHLCHTTTQDILTTGYRRAASFRPEI